MKHSLRLIQILIVFLLVFVPTTVKADGPDFGIKPEQPGIGYFRFTIKPGEKVEDALLATNVGSESVYVKVMPVGAITALGGGLSYDFANTSPVLNWISMPDAGTFKIKSGRFFKLPFTVTVPEGTKPGEYVAGFLAAKDDTMEEQSTLAPNSMNVKVVSQIAIAIVITVPGETECKAEVQSVEDFPSNTGWHFGIKLNNLGNVPFSGKGSIQIFTNDELTQSRQFDLGYTVAGLPFALSMDLDAPKAGDQRVVLSITDKKDPNCKIDYVYNKKISKSEASDISKAITVPEITKENTPAQSVETTSAPVVASMQQQPNMTILYVSIALVIVAILLFAGTFILLRKRK